MPEAGVSFFRILRAVSYNGRMSDFEKTANTRIRRMPERGHYDRETVYSIVDEALICHAGFVEAGRPFVIPTIHARMGDTLVLHGAKASRLLKHAQAGNELCITITLLDGLVMARSVFHHSMNYRSAVMFGKGRLIESEDERWKAMRALTEHIMPGRWDDARQPNATELSATTMVAVDIEEASAKIRTGPPGDDEEDYALDVWTGVLPIMAHIGQPIDDPRRTHDIALPDYITHHRR
jgi:nitroimidazol reductase NimA-like FMN-containing flavoprotein (pyridoxamine 5'-phosphate oxidase superfamily)